MNQKQFDLSTFIKTHVTERKESLLAQDLKLHHNRLSDFINGGRFLVIGGAGTIGSSYIKALLKFKPKTLIVVDKSENGLAELVRDLRSSVGYNIPDDFILYPFNYASSAFSRLLDSQDGFDLVANFAAHKHVRSEKDKLSVQAMLENNVLNLFDLLERLKEKPPRAFFSVSTDKAANPVNVMGASKKLMEELMFAYTNHFNIRSARFANVAFSNGSLPFAFLRRLEKSQPLSSPNDVKRYFVSPEESGELCLLASIVPEAHAISFPKLDENRDMKTFSHIAEKLLTEKGFSIGYCDSEDEAKEKALSMDQQTAYPVYFFKTDTSGEKMYEEFYTDNEEVDFDTFKNLGLIPKTQSLSEASLTETMKQLKDVLDNENTDKAIIVSLIKTIIPDFQHIETGKNLDQKM